MVTDFHPQELAQRAELLAKFGPPLDVELPKHYEAKAWIEAQLGRPSLKPPELVQREHTLRVIARGADRARRGQDLLQHLAEAFSAAIE